MKVFPSYVLACVFVALPIYGLQEISGRLERNACTDVRTTHTRPFDQNQPLIETQDTYVQAEAFLFGEEVIHALPRNVSFFWQNEDDNNEPVSKKRKSDFSYQSAQSHSPVLGFSATQATSHGSNIHYNREIPSTIGSDIHCQRPSISFFHELERKGVSADSMYEHAMRITEKHKNSVAAELRHHLIHNPLHDLTVNARLLALLSVGKKNDIYWSELATLQWPECIARRIFKNAPVEDIKIAIRHGNFSSDVLRILTRYEQKNSFTTLLKEMAISLSHHQKCILFANVQNNPITELPSYMALIIKELFKNVSPINGTAASQLFAPQYLPVELILQTEATAESTQEIFTRGKVKQIEMAINSGRVIPNIEEVLSRRGFSERTVDRLIARAIPWQSVIQQRVPPHGNQTNSSFCYAFHVQPPYKGA